MTAYVVADSAVLDEKGLPAYVALAGPSIARHSGRFLAQGQEPVAVEEGDWPKERVVTILEFPDIQHATDWYASAEYKKAIEVRQGALDVRAVFVDGEVPFQVPDLQGEE